MDRLIISTLSMLFTRLGDVSASNFILLPIESREFHFHRVVNCFVVVEALQSEHRMCYPVSNPIHIPQHTHPLALHTDSVMKTQGIIGSFVTCGYANSNEQQTIMKLGTIILGVIGAVGYMTIALLLKRSYLLLFLVVTVLLLPSQNAYGSVGYSSGGPTVVLK